jgi:3-dehydroquinate dehydratase-2
LIHSIESWIAQEDVHGVAGLARILVLNGPNLNLLGVREPDVYGQLTLADIESRLAALAERSGHGLEFFQSNAEHEIIGRIHRAAVEKVAFAIFNPAAFTHTSIALRDALLATELPFIEVHLSNVHAREPFRQHSYFSDIAHGVITGLGLLGYELALQAAMQHIGGR